MGRTTKFVDPGRMKNVRQPTKEKLLVDLKISNDRRRSTRSSRSIKESMSSTVEIENSFRFAVDKNAQMSAELFVLSVNFRDSFIGGLIKIVHKKVKFVEVELSFFRQNADSRRRSEENKFEFVGGKLFESDLFRQKIVEKMFR